MDFFAELGSRSASRRLILGGGCFFFFWPARLKYPEGAKFSKNCSLVIAWAIPRICMLCPRSQVPRKMAPPKLASGACGGADLRNDIPGTSLAYSKGSAEEPWCRPSHSESNLRWGRQFCCTFRGRSSGATGILRWRKPFTMETLGRRHDAADATCFVRFRASDFGFVGCGVLGWHQHKSDNNDNKLKHE